MGPDTVSLLSCLPALWLCEEGGDGESGSPRTAKWDLTLLLIQQCLRLSRLELSEFRIYPQVNPERAATKRLPGERGGEDHDSTQSGIAETMVGGTHGVAGERGEVHQIARSIESPATAAALGEGGQEICL